MPKIVPGVLKAVQRDDDELHERSLQAFEALLLRCPTELALYVAPIVEPGRFPCIKYNPVRFFRPALGVIRLNPVVSARLLKVPVPVHPRHSSMLIKLKSRINYNEGGYLYPKTHVMRFKYLVEQWSYLK
ncbi:hypothetical protein B0H11DRAFT_2260041 [Mycena galericulata]|nr:hypothetical protein B0H11DRAFT_2260041 [Mycena galericulata]